ncbi:hypothetical protein FIBSPDRAFT_1055588 [Athelia psychrophila]|uniref:Uncharacterized protein n=1 Tax=Athelia psychrophila TaxID=1759441 RepID=A0A167TFI2_9AGAM|nr:hypothetical protein FIBSPDRAFT_1055588 [Fibularhizoctonia sp. CBS 109695]
MVRSAARVDAIVVAMTSSRPRNDFARSVASTPHSARAPTHRVRLAHPPSSTRTRTTRRNTVPSHACTQPRRHPRSHQAAHAHTYWASTTTSTVSRTPNPYTSRRTRTFSWAPAPGAGRRPTATTLTCLRPRTFDGGVRLEDAPVIVPSQVAFYRSSSSHAHLSRSHLSVHQCHPTSKMGTTANSEAAQTRHT